LLFAVVLVTLSRVVAADAITEWNEKAATCIARVSQLPFVGTRTMAIVHTSMFDAINSVEGGYKPYRTKITAVKGSSSEAAAVAAAHAALAKLFPELKDYARRRIRQLPGQTSRKQGGVEVGEKVAGEILAFRDADGAEAPNKFRPVTSPGAHVVTALPVATEWSGVKPWAMEKSSQFPPPTAGTYQLRLGS